MKRDKIRSKKIRKDGYLSYWKKARELESVMQTALLKSNWNAAALNALHAAILANDALLIYFHGIKSISQKHDDAVKLLTSLIKSREAQKYSRHLRKLITEKSIISYTGKLLSPGKSKELCKHAQRFITWVSSMLPNEQDSSI